MNFENPSQPAKSNDQATELNLDMSDREFLDRFKQLHPELIEDNPEERTSSRTEQMVDTMTDREVIDAVKSDLQEDAESREVKKEAPVIEIAGKRIQVDAYTETWQDAARKYRERPRAVEKQMMQISHDLALLTTQVQQVTDRMMRMQELSSESESVLNAEQQAQITERLLAFQPLHEYNAIFTNAEQTLEEVKKILIDAERQNGMESARNIVSSDSSSNENV